jgi:DNA-binding MarR family transcriptional regulator
MRADPSAVTEHILELAEEFYRAARYHVPRDWLQADLTMTQLKVLLTIFLDGPQTCTALAGAVGLSQPTMTGILQRLAARRYLERQQDPQDHRRNIAALTAEGQELVERLWASGRDQMATLMDDIDLEGLRAVERALGILIKAVRDQQKAEPPGQPSVEAIS